jgi:tRNA(Ile)-lysidine synthase
MEQIVKEFIAKNHILDGVSTIVLAVSGGADSMALAYFMLSNFPDYRYTIAHVHHGLRTEAGEDEALVHAFAKERGVPFRCHHCDIASIAKAEKQGIEETGRNERYRFFRSLGADLILTAHHKNDTVETVLLHLIRGSGLKGVTGIAPREKDLGRPFLCLGKEMLVAYCKEHKIVFAEDMTNHDTAYTRNKVRHTLLPLMETINPDVVDAIYRFSLIAAGDEAVMDAAAEKFLDFFLQYENGDLVLDKDELLGLDEPLAKRVIRAAAARAGGAVDYELTEKIFALDEGKKLPLTTNLWARVEGGYIRFTAEKERIMPQLNIVLPLCGKIDMIEIGVTAEMCTVTGKQKGSPADLGFFPAYFFAEEPPVLRYRQTGDRIQLEDGKTKKLSDYFIDEKIPQSQRDQTPLLTVGGRILWVVGHRFFASPGDENIMFRFSFGKYSSN